VTTTCADAIDIHGRIMAAASITVATYASGQTAHALQRDLGLNPEDPADKVVIAAAGILARLSLLNAGLTGRVRGEHVAATWAWRVFAEHETAAFEPFARRAAGEETVS
jgi:hypothetical protein